MPEFSYMKPACFKPDKQKYYNAWILNQVQWFKPKKVLYCHTRLPEKYGKGLLEDGIARKQVGDWHDNESKEGKSRCVNYCPDRYAQKNMSSHIRNVKDSVAHDYI